MTWPINCNTRFNERLGGGVVRYLVLCDIELHRRAQNTLQESIVQLLRNPCALRKTLLESDIQLARQQVDSQAIENYHRQNHDRYIQALEPPRLPIGPGNREGMIVSGPFQSPRHSMPRYESDRSPDQDSCR